MIDLALVMAVANSTVALSVGEFGTVGEGEGAVVKLHVLYVIFLSAVYPRELWSSDVHIGKIKVSYSFHLYVEIGVYINIYGSTVRLIHNYIIEGHIFYQGSLSADVCRAGIIFAWLYVRQEEVDSAGAVGKNKV